MCLAEALKGNSDLSFKYYLQLILFKRKKQNYKEAKRLTDNRTCCSVWSKAENRSAVLAKKTLTPTDLKIPQIQSGRLPPPQHG